MYLQATVNIALHITIGQGLSCGCTSAATSGLWCVWAGKLHFKGHMDIPTFKQVLGWKQAHGTLLDVQRHDSTGVHGTITLWFEMGQPSTVEHKHQEQAAAQTPAFPFVLHTITQTHHDEHNNYWAHTALRLHELSMSTQKATEAGITGWDNHGTKEWTPWDGGNLHPLTNLPTGNFPIPPNSPIPLG